MRVYECRCTEAMNRLTESCVKIYILLCEQSPQIAIISHFFNYYYWDGDGDLMVIGKFINIEFSKKKS